MIGTLLDAFIAEECTAEVQRKVQTALADGAWTRLELQFNRFDITIDRATENVTIFDVLDATESGEQTVSLETFFHALPLSFATSDSEN